LESPDGQTLAHLCLDLGYKFSEKPGDLTRLQVEFLMTGLRFRGEQLTQAKLASEGIQRMIISGDQ
jgi:hypothetical protein